MALSWNTTTSLPENRVYSQAIAYNGWMYIVGGGVTDQTTSNSIYVAQINANGTLGSWTMSPNVLPVSRSQFSLVIIGNTMLAINGNVPPNFVGINSVYRSTIAGNGDLGVWTQTTNTNVNAVFGMAVGYNGSGTLYVLGGRSGGTDYYAQVRRHYMSGGELGGAIAATALPAPRFAAASFLYGGSLYIVGGYNNAGSLTTAYAATRDGDDLGTWDLCSGGNQQINRDAQLIGNTLWGLDGSTAVKGVITSDKAFSWSSEALPFTPTGGSFMASYGSKLYFFGGTSNLTTWYTDTAPLPKSPLSRFHSGFSTGLNGGMS